MHLHGILPRAAVVLGVLSLTLGALAAGHSASCVSPHGHHLPISLTHSPSPPFQCSKLSNLLPKAVYYPGADAAASNGGDPSISFTALNTHRWSNTSILNPACILRPTSAADLGSAVSHLATAKCPFAVKSGGHTPVPGANDIDGGVSIDLSGLAQTVYLPSSGGDVVRLGVGATWQMAYDALVVPHGIGFPGGLCGTTGVGGVALGGGQSVFQPKVGWVMDNVVEYEMVLATGEVVVVNAGTRGDLFKALKGGGLAANFGIVTRVDVKAFPLPGGKVWGGALIMPVTDAIKSQTLQAITAYTALNNEDTDAATQVLMTYGSNGVSVIEIALFNGAGEANSTAMQPIMAMSNYNVAGVGQWGSTTLDALIKGFDPAQPWGLRYVVASFEMGDGQPGITRLSVCF